MPRDLRETAQFKSDKKRVKKSGRHDWEKLRSLVALLMNDQPLPAKNRDHKLRLPEVIRARASTMMTLIARVPWLAVGSCAKPATAIESIRTGK